MSFHKRPELTDAFPKGWSFPTSASETKGLLKNEKVQIAIAKVELNLYCQSTPTIVRLKNVPSKIGEVLFLTFLRFGKDLITKYHYLVS